MAIKLLFGEVSCDPFIYIYINLHLTQDQCAFYFEHHLNPIGIARLEPGRKRNGQLQANSHFLEEPISGGSQF
jgi:hypothetical protein